MSGVHQLPTGTGGPPRASETTKAVLIPDRAQKSVPHGVTQSGLGFFELLLSAAVSLERTASPEPQAEMRNEATTRKTGVSLVV
jgi:hypothetical protein